MSLPPDILNTLRYGECLAAQVPPRHDGWRAWVHVEPVSNRRFPLAVNDPTEIRFIVRRVELSEWHLDEKWQLDLDIAIQHRPIFDEIFQLENPGDLMAWLVRVNCDASSLQIPYRVDYPHPPATNNGSIGAG